MKNEKVRQSIFSKKVFTKGSLSPRLIFFVCCIVMIPVLFIACEYSNKPGIIYDPNVRVDVSGKPTITGISPAAGAVGGVREITINGTNLGVVNGDTNWVYFGAVRPLIKEIHDSYITIYRPRLSNDHYDRTITVSVTNTNLLTVSSSLSYTVQTPGAVTGDYSAPQQPILAVEFDNQTAEYLYAVAGRTLYKTDFAGVTQIVVLNQVNLLSGDFNSITDMKFGPGTYGRNLFIAVGKNSISRYYVVDTLNRNNTRKLLTVPAVVSQLDFDANGNLYVAGNSNLYVADTSVGNSTAPIFTTISGFAGVGNLTKIRVIKASGNQYIYIADSVHVWKGQLTGGSLTMGAPVVDLSTHSELAGCKLSSFEVDINGSLFLCLKNNPNYSLFFAESDGSITPFYKDPSILPNTVDKMVWGNTNSLYLISSSLQSSPGSYAGGRIYRMSLDRNGAPYEGRKFIH